MFGVGVGGGGGGGSGGRSSGSGSSSGGGGEVGGRESQARPVGGSSSSYTPTHHQRMNMSVNMNMLLPPPPLQPPQLLLSPTASVGTAAINSGYDDDDFPKRDERAVQWGIQETRDFIAIRAKLEGDFTVSKRNKALWEVVAARMKDLGYRRTPDQCKCKWKNLVNRYKGKETSDPDEGHQFPFFHELHAIFSATANHMQQPHVESEVGSMQSRKRPRIANRDESSEELLEIEEGDEESDEDRIPKVGIAKKRKIEKEKRPQTSASGKSPRKPSNANVGNSESIVASMSEMLRNFFHQQERIEMQWRESMEKHAQERELFEHEWRQTMEKLERERIMMEQAWREREEQRRVREESRAEKRDALLTTLLNRLIQEKST